jgi:Holliday junction resolvasome RuvABC endonuclease subunit
MKYILAVDPSLTSTGYTVLNENREIIEIDKITSSTKDGTENQRIHNILHVLDIKVNIHNIKEIAIEDGFTGPNKKGSLDLAKLRGAIVGYFEMKGCTVNETEPKSTRVNLGLKGNASKEEVAEYIINLYPELVDIIGPYSDKNNKKKTSDMYDSVCIGLAYLNKQER